MFTIYSTISFFVSNPLHSLIKFDIIHHRVEV